MLWGYDIVMEKPPEFNDPSVLHPRGDIVSQTMTFPIARVNDNDFVQSVKKVVASSFSISEIIGQPFVGSELKNQLLEPLLALNTVFFSSLGVVLNDGVQVRVSRSYSDGQLKDWKDSLQIVYPQNFSDPPRLAALVRDLRSELPAIDQQDIRGAPQRRGPKILCGTRRKPAATTTNTGRLFCGVTGLYAKAVKRERGASHGA